MDNCAIHHDEDVRAIVEGECGTSIEINGRILPPPTYY